MSFLSLVFFFLLLSLLSLNALSQPLRGTFIDCGATVESEIDGRQWLPDADFISTGTSRKLEIPVLSPLLSTVRSFPLLGNLLRKHCYSVPTYRGGKYLIRTTYFYGGVNGQDLPPVFDQIVDGTFWSVVNTTGDYLQGMSSYYEGVFVAATGKSISVCIAANSYTDSDPFMSSLELVLLEDSLYNSTDFGQFGLSLVSRSSFGYNGSIIRFPDDSFDRYWEPFQDNSASSVARNREDVPVSGFWNLPPLKIFQTELASAQPGPLELRWPLTSLPNSTYYIALYFVADGDSSNSNTFSISINNVTYIRDLNVTPAGVMVFANQWLLAGLTDIILTSAAGSTVGPSINAGEIFDVLPLGGKTATKDVIGLEQLKNSFKNPPQDWNGDPCLPSEYSWTGVTCSEGQKVRVVALNLTSMGLSGSLSSYLGNLTALTDIWLGNNSLSGTIPDLSSLKRLEKLHLEDNRFTGGILPSLGTIESLSEIFLQGNNLTGRVPENLAGKPGLNLKTSPGNQLLLPSPS